MNKSYFNIFDCMSATRILLFFILYVLILAWLMWKWYMILAMWKKTLSKILKKSLASVWQQLAMQLVLEIGLCKVSKKVFTWSKQVKKYLLLQHSVKLTQKNSLNVWNVLSLITFLLSAVATAHASVQEVSLSLQQTKRIFISNHLLFLIFLMKSFFTSLLSSLIFVIFSLSPIPLNIYFSFPAIQTSTLTILHNEEQKHTFLAIPMTSSPRWNKLSALFITFGLQLTPFAILFTPVQMKISIPHAQKTSQNIDTLQQHTIRMLNFPCSAITVAALQQLKNRSGKLYNFPQLLTIFTIGKKKNEEKPKTVSGINQNNSTNEKDRFSSSKGKKQQKKPR